MRSREIARRYAEALYSVAEEEDRVDAAEGELRQVTETLRDVPELSKLLEHPLVDRASKIDLAQTAFPELSDSTKNLLRLLVGNGREAYLDLILDEFLVVRAQFEGVLRARAVSAQALTEEERGRLTARLEAVLGHRVQLETAIDSEVLAGVRLELDGRVLDGTLRARLDELHHVLEQ